MPLTLEEEPIELKEAAARSADGGNFADDTFVQDLLREADHPKLSSEELQTLMFNMTFDQAKQVSQATTNDNITKLLAVAARLKRNTSATLAFRDVCLELDGVLKLRGVRCCYFCLFGRHVRLCFCLVKRKSDSRLLPPSPVQCSITYYIYIIDTVCAVRRRHAICLSVMNKDPRSILHYEFIFCALYD